MRMDCRLAASWPLAANPSIQQASSKPAAFLLACTVLFLWHNGLIIGLGPKLLEADLDHGRHGGAAFAAASDGIVDRVAGLRRWRIIRLGNHRREGQHPVEGRHRATPERFQTYSLGCLGVGARGRAPQYQHAIRFSSLGTRSLPFVAGGAGIVFGQF